jgi:DNA-binding transcriptional MocR family regulator
VTGIVQRLVARLWADEAVMATVARAGEAYTERRTALAALLGLPVPPSGINLWVPVADEDAAARALLAEGYAIAPGRPYRLSGGPAIRITTASVDVSEAPALAAAVRRAAAPSRRTRAA